MSDEPTIERRLPISDDDMRAIVRLVGGIAGMAEPIAERRRALITALADLVGAQVWVWVHSAGLETQTPVALGVIDGGWLDDAERNRMWRANFDPAVNAAFAKCVPTLRPATLQFDETCAGWGDGSVYRDLIAPTGLARLAFSFHPLPGGVMSGIGLHRRADRPPFSPRELAVVHLVLGQVDWLHQFDPPPVVESSALKMMTPREREVLVHLLGGDSRKQIARKLALSPHTVGDHVKSLHKRLGVGSRGELMAKFLPAGS